MDAKKALELIKEAVGQGRYFLDPHALKRMEQRNISFHDIRNAVMASAGCQPYRDPRRQIDTEVSSWRVNGFDFDGERLDVGVDLSQDHLGAFVVVITVF